MPTFEQFVQTELPKRPFTDSDGTPGQVLARSGNVQAVRELVWVDLPGIDPGLEKTASHDISGHRAVAVGSDGALKYADPTKPWEFIGISKNAALMGGAVGIAHRDTITEPSWNWTPGETIYFVADGVLTQSAPASAAWTPIAVALSATTILLTRQSPVLLGA